QRHRVARPRQGSVEGFPQAVCRLQANELASGLTLRPSGQPREQLGIGRGGGRDRRALHDVRRYWAPPGPRRPGNIGHVDAHDAADVGSQSVIAHHLLLARLNGMGQAGSLLAVPVRSPSPWAFAAQLTALDAVVRPAAVHRWEADTGVALS